MISFEEFYTVVHGHAPRVWQSDLARQVIDRGWPDAVKAVTGAGKTSVIDIAVYALAHEVESILERGGDPLTERTMDLRIVLGVERRLIVDEAYSHAERLVQAVESSPELASVKDALRALIPDGPTILLTSMHGATTWDRLWWRPVGCSIILGTMTQITSRVLFRGVGESPATQRLSAAVLGSDCLRFCDEPHLMTNAVAALRDQQTLVNIRPPHTVVLGATPLASTLDGDVFEAQMPTRRFPRTLRVLSGEDSTARKNLMVGAAVEAHNAGKSVVVLVSRVKSATAVATAIRSSKIPCRVLTSRIRGYDRQDVEVPMPDGILVATQTLEAGVDFDADVIVSDLAPLPSLIQRHGRVGRRDDRPAEMVVVVEPTEEEEKHDKKGNFTGYEYTKSDNHAVYGARALHFTRVALESLDSLDGVDVSDEKYADTWVPATREVRLNEEMADLLSDTSATAPWESYLHSPDDKNTGTVTLLWREEPELVDRVRPRPGETLEVPLWVARDLMQGTVPAELGDEGLVSESKSKALKYGTVWDRKNSPVQAKSMHDLKPGNVLVLPCEAGNYLPEQGIVTSKTPVTDLSVECTDMAGESTAFIPLKRIVGDAVESILDGTVDLDPECIPEGFHQEGELLARRFQYATKSGKVVRLADHLDQVGDSAATYAHYAGMDESSFRTAGVHHDLGKALPDFQRFRLGNMNDPEPWAKSRVSIRTSGSPLPSPWRHESAVARTLMEVDPLASWLVADHHGKGHVHQMGDGIHQVSRLPEGMSVWDAAAVSAVFRWADWEVSGSPEDRGLTMADLDLIDVPDLQTPEPVQPAGSVITLPGFDSNYLRNRMMSFGALQAVSEVDPDAQIRMFVDHAEIVTTAEIRWEPIESLVGKRVSPKYAKFAADTDPTYSASCWGAGDKGQVPLASMTCHRNSGNWYSDPLTNGESVPVDCLYDADSGWSDTGDVGFGEGLTTEAQSKNVYGQFRADANMWAMRGQWLFGAPQSALGAGVVNKILTVPEADHWSTVDEIRAAARRGVGDKYVKHQTDNEYSHLWMPA